MKEEQKKLEFYQKTIFSYIEEMYENDEFLMSMISRYKEINAKIVPLLEMGNRAKEITNIVDNTNVLKLKEKVSDRELTKTFGQCTNEGLSTPEFPKSVLEGLMKSKDMISRVKKYEEVKSSTSRVKKYEEVKPSTQNEEFELFKKNNKFIKNFLAGFEQDKQSEETIEFLKNNPPKSCDEIPKEVQEALDKDLTKKKN